MSTFECRCCNKLSYSWVPSINVFQDFLQTCCWHALWFIKDKDPITDRHPRTIEEPQDCQHRGSSVVLVCLMNFIHLIRTQHCLNLSDHCRNIFLLYPTEIHHLGFNQSIYMFFGSSKERIQGQAAPSLFCFLTPFFVLLVNKRC